MYGRIIEALFTFILVLVMRPEIMNLVHNFTNQLQTGLGS